MGNKKVTKLDTLNVKQLQTAIKVLDEKMKEKGVSEKTKKKLDRMKNNYAAQIEKTKALYKKNQKKIPGQNACMLSVLKIYQLLHKADENNPKISSLNPHGFWNNTFGKHPVVSSFAAVGITAALTSAMLIPGVANAVGIAFSKIFLAFIPVAGGAFGLTGLASAAATVGVWSGAVLAGTFIAHRIKKSIAKNRALQFDIDKKIEEDTVYNSDNLDKNFEQTKNKLIEDALTNGQKDEILSHLESVANSDSHTPTEKANAVKLIGEIYKKEAQMKDEIIKANNQNKVLYAQTQIQNTIQNTPKARKFLSAFYSLVGLNDKVIAAEENYQKSKDLQDFEKDTRTALDKAINNLNKKDAEKTQAKREMDDAQTTLNPYQTQYEAALQAKTSAETTHTTNLDSYANKVKDLGLKMYGSTGQKGANRYNLKNNVPPNYATYNFNVPDVINNNTTAKQTFDNLITSYNSSNFLITAKTNNNNNKIVSYDLSFNSNTETLDVYDNNNKVVFNKKLDAYIKNINLESQFNNVQPTINVQKNDLIGLRAYIKDQIVQALLKTEITNIQTSEQELNTKQNELSNAEQAKQPYQADFAQKQQKYNTIENEYNQLESIKTEKERIHSEAEAEYNKIKNKMPEQKSKIDKAKDILAKEGTSILGSDYNGFNNLVGDVKSEITTILKNSKLFKTDKLNDITQMPLEKLLNTLKNFIPQENDLVAEEVKDASLLKN